MLLLFGLALVLNVNSASAANVTTDLIKPKVNAVNPAKNTVTLYNKPIKVTFSESIKYGNKAISLTNAGKVKSTKLSISGKTLTITPKTPLIKGATYKLLIHSGAVTDMSGNSVSLYKSSFTVSPITLTQMKGGISKVQKFYNNNNRLPGYVSFGTKKIPIKQFQKIIASQGLKITTHTTCSC